MPLKIGNIQLTKQQTIFIGIVLGVILLVSLVFARALPGRRPPVLKSDIIVWGTGDESRVWRDTINRFESTYSGVNVKYVSVSEENYEAELLNALAAGRGPDIFMFHSKWLPRHIDKIVPASQDKLTQITFSSLFPQVTEGDLTVDSKIYAMPLSVDTLAMAYNRDIFDRKQVVFPPRTWDDFEKVIPKLSETEGSNISESGAAIGEDSSSVKNSTDLLSVMMMQYGTPIVSPGSNRADFLPGGITALGRYTQFTDSSDSLYTWDNSLGSSNEAFANEKTAITFVYPNDAREIQTINPFVDMEISPLPQIDASKPINYASYWALAVSSQSRNANIAWDFVIFATTDQATAREYISRTGHPPALRFLIDDYLLNPNVGIFAKQALTAQSWAQPDEVEVGKIFDDMIKKAISGEVSIDKAISQAKSEITQLLRKN